MKVLSRLVIALVICLITIPMLATPAQADESITFNPKNGNVDQKVHVIGYFAPEDEDSTVYIYYEVADDEWELVDSSASIDDEGDLKDAYFNVPPSCRGEHEVRVCISKQSDADPHFAEGDFTVEPSLEIAKPSSEKGAAGTTVELKGWGWDASESEIEVRFYLESPGTTHYDDEDYYVSFGPTDIDVNGYGSWEDVTFKVPPASEGKHWIYAVGDETDSIKTDKVKGVKFEVLPGISLDIEKGSPGDTVTVTGSGFKANETSIEILFDGTAVEEDIKADENGLWEESFEVSEAVNGKYDVTADGSYTKKADIDEVEFEVVPGLALSPTEGHVGTMLTVSGGGFPASKLVSITYDGVQQGTATTTTNGSFSGVSFEATHTQTIHTVKHPVAATYDSTSVSATNFVMESIAPPTSTLNSPVDGSRAGFMGWKFRSTFEWSAVIDDSGVSHYSLRIASSEVATEPTLFLFSQDLSMENLTLDTETGMVSYKLPKENALPYGAYCWQVKAVDGAQNEGAWAATQSFKAGFLPLWASIVIIVLIVVLISALVYFFAIKRRSDYD